jgi:hypothetical protein
MITENRINMANKIRNVGIALLGGHGNAFGRYELGIDSIRMVNEDDVTAPPSQYPDCWQMIPDAYPPIFYIRKISSRKGA